MKGALGLCQVYDIELLSIYLPLRVANLGAMPQVSRRELQRSMMRTRQAANRVSLRDLSRHQSGHLSALREQMGSGFGVSAPNAIRPVLLLESRDLSRLGAGGG